MSHPLVECPKWLISEALSSLKYPIKKQRSDFIAFPISVLLGHQSLASLRERTRSLDCKSGEIYGGTFRVKAKPPKNNP